MQTGAAATTSGAGGAACWTGALCIAFGRDQRHEPDIRAGADTLQHHVTDADWGFEAALLQRVTARIVKAGFVEIAKTQ